MLRRAFHRGGCRFHGIRLFCLVVAIGVAPAVAEDSVPLATLAEAGAPALALVLLEARQPDPARQPAAWEAWQRERIAMLAAQMDWSGIADALAVMPNKVSPAFRRWAAGERARALLNGGKPAKARTLWAELIWGYTADRAQLATWREAVIQSYLAEGRTDDALTAMLRFRQDYGDGGREQALLRARVLLESGRPEDAIAAVAHLDDDLSARALVLRARLRAGAHPRQVIQSAEHLLAESPGAEETRQLLQVIAEAAERASDPARQAIALEQLLGRSTAGLADLPEASALWQAYYRYARRVGNRSRLLIGDDDAWFALAASEPEQYPVRTRSIYALLAAEAADAGARERAHGELVANLLSLDGGEALIARLYLEGESFGPLETLPARVRYPLIDRTIRRGDLEEAARLLTGLEAPPDRAEWVGWQLRRARVFVLAGEPEKAAEVLDALTAPGADALAPLWRDRLIQVVFDLQTVGEHDAACRLFGALAATAAPALRRELLYWMAESRQKQGRFREAARLYLESAVLPGPAAMDPWAQTSRFQAAKALAEAGLVGDARNLLTRLLEVTDDPKRKAVLRRELEQLGLHGQSVAAP